MYELTDSMYQAGCIYSQVACHSRYAHKTMQYVNMELLLSTPPQRGQATPRDSAILG